MTPRRFINLFPKKYIFKKLVNYGLFKLSYMLNLKKLIYLPVTMDIEPTTGCNFRCTMCQVSSPDFHSKNMELETFKKIIRENIQLIKIKLQGMGEPLVNKNLFEMIKYAKEYGVGTEIISNGSLLNEKNINFLLDNKLSKLTISIDGSSKKTFEKIRIKSNFETVINNAKLFSNLTKKKIFRPEFSAWCTVQKENYDEVEEIAALCKSIGFDNLTFQVHLTGWGKDEWNKINEEKKIEYKNLEIKKRFKDIINNYSQKNFTIDVFENNLLNFKKKCSWPINSSYLASTGDVVPCCIIGDPKVINYGNIKTQSFKEIWNSKAYYKLRDNIENNQIDDFCKNCYREYTH